MIMRYKLYRFIVDFVNNARSENDMLLPEMLLGSSIGS